MVILNTNLDNNDYGEYNDNFNNNNVVESNNNFDNNLNIDNDFYKYEDQNYNDDNNKPKKSKKIILYLAIVLIILIALLGSLAFFYYKDKDTNKPNDGGGTEQPVLVPNLVLNTKEFDLKVSSTKKIEYTIENDNGNLVITWSSSNTKIATVDQNGLVKGVKAGNATITASYTIDGQSYEKTCEVTVINNSSSGGSSSSGTTTDKTDPKLSYTITKGKENEWVNTDVEIKVTASDNVGVNTIQYTKNCTSNCKYTTIKNNEIITISETGSTTITIIAKDKAGNSATKTVKVKIDKIKPTCSLSVSETGTLSATPKDTGGSDLSYNGFSSAYSGTSSSSQTLSKAGTYTYYVKDKAGNTNTCSLEVKTKTQYRYRDCTSCKSCSNAGCAKYTDTPLGNSYTVCQSSPTGSGTIKESYIVITCENKTIQAADATECPGKYKCTGQRYLCSYYNQSCSSCGCSSYGSWSAWGETKYTETSSRDVETKTIYY